MIQVNDEPETLTKPAPKEEVQLTSFDMTDLDPPRKRGEMARDYILAWLDGRFIPVLNIIALFLIMVDGTFFFFLLVGWHGMCTPRMDCELRNWWFNWSLQVLTGLFTYTATVALPWRLIHFWHTAGLTARKHAVGHDLYGWPTKDIWFHIPPSRRLGIIIALLMNAFTQYANQAARIMYYNYDLQNEHGFAVTFFAMMSFFFAFVAGCWLLWESGKLRKENPELFDDGGAPLDIAREWFDKLCYCRCDKEQDKPQKEEGELLDV